MPEFIKSIFSQILIVILVLVVWFLFSLDWRSSEEKQAGAQTRRLVIEWADKLDQRLTAAGVYVHWETESLPDQDAWGTPLHVTYKDERVYEQVIVKSAGKDKIFGNNDDIVEKRKQINMKGIGEGIKKIDTAGVAASVAKGVAIGIKEAIKEGHDKSRP
jgi:hypothetical protein